MITTTFDNKSRAIINPGEPDKNLVYDACIVTFSNIIEDYVINNYDCKKVSEFKFVTGRTPIYEINYKSKKFAFYKTYVGSPACVGTIEDTISKIVVKDFIVFGGAGCLDKDIAFGKIMIPTESYRDEGTSFHYMEASDYVKIKNFKIVEEFFKSINIPYVLGKNWTTDSFYRETENNFRKHKEDGCISVEMECSALQAMCNFRNLNYYTFFSSGDLLDAPEWDERKVENEYTGTQHDKRLFELALDLAYYIVKNKK